MSCTIPTTSNAVPHASIKWKGRAPYPCGSTAGGGGTGGHDTETLDNIEPHKVSLDLVLQGAR